MGNDLGRCPLSRRRFLVGLGAGAVASTLGAAGARAADTAGPPGPYRITFGRLFPELAPFAEPSDALRAALRDIGKPGGILDAGDDLAAGPIALFEDPSFSVNNPDNPSHTAGTTFMAQFLDHDVTFDVASPLGVPTEPTTSPNGRTPRFDLDSLYGGGPIASPSLYNLGNRAKLRIESGGLFEDLPRDPDSIAVIADPRNDEHVIICGLTCAFILFHNHAVDHVRKTAGPTVSFSEIFAAARQLTTWHYQWMIVHEFLPLFVGQPMVDDVMANGRRFFRPAAGQAFIPVEFQGAAYRFGHSMVRPSYRANLATLTRRPFVGFIFDPTLEAGPDPDDLVGGHRAPRRFVDWNTFFDFGDGIVAHDKRIDTHLSTPLFNLPVSAIPTHEAPTALPQRDLLRQVTWSIPSGQDVARAMGELPFTVEELAGYGLGLETSTPLWYYVLKEAEVIPDGLHLGPVGGRIVAEVFLGLLQLDPGSYLNQSPAWRPTLPQRSGAVTGDFRMVDFLTFAGVDPASRAANSSTAPTPAAPTPPVA